MSANHSGLVTELYETHNAGGIDAETELLMRGTTELSEALGRLIPARTIR